MMIRVYAAAILVLSYLTAPSASAITVTMEQVGNDVVATTSGGVLDLTGAGLTAVVVDAVLSSGGVIPGTTAASTQGTAQALGGSIRLGSTSAADVYETVASNISFSGNFDAFGNLGTENVIAGQAPGGSENADISTGNGFGVNLLTNIAIPTFRLIVPGDFCAGSEVGDPGCVGTIGAGSATWQNETLSSLGTLPPFIPITTTGVEPGTYVWSWGSGEGESVTLNVVPIPGAVWLFGSALVGIIGFRRRFAAGR